MNRTQKLIGAAVLAIVVVAAGIGVAYAVGGDPEEQITGPDAEKAKQSAIDAAGGGTVQEAERADGGNGAYEVEVKRPDGSVVDVKVGADFKSLGTAGDDDQGGKPDDGDSEGSEDG